MQQSQQTHAKNDQAVELLKQMSSAAQSIKNAVERGVRVDNTSVLKLAGANYLGGDRASKATLQRAKRDWDVKIDGYSFLDDLKSGDAHITSRAEKRSLRGMARKMGLDTPGAVDPLIENAQVTGATETVVQGAGAAGKALKGAGALGTLGKLGKRALGAAGLIGTAATLAGAAFPGTASVGGNLQFFQQKQQEGLAQLTPMGMLENLATVTIGRAVYSTIVLPSHFGPQPFQR